MPWQDVRPSVRLSHAGFLSKRLYTVFQKTCDHVFDNKLNQNCPFTKIFGILITKTIGHQQVFLVHTYSMQLLYLGKLSIPKYYEYSLKVLIFSMQQYEDINCKTVTILFYLLITVYNRTITRFIADDDGVYQRVRWLMRDATGFRRQQLSTTSFEAFELEIAVNYPVHTWTENNSFMRNLTS